MIGSAESRSATSKRNVLSLVAQLANKLVELDSSLGTAESCTGGGIGAALTSISGSSRWYSGGVIAYSNQIKTGVLGVDPRILEEKGAVSVEVAYAMAEGVGLILDTDIAIATTGIAGPDGGTKEKPVGTVCFGWSIEEYVVTESCHFPGDRTQVQQLSIEHAIKRLIELL